MSPSRARLIGRTAQAFACAALFVIASCANDPAIDQKSMRAQAGILDLSRWDFGKQGITPLHGDYHFAWGRLESPGFAQGAPKDPQQARPDLMAIPAAWNGKTIGNPPERLPGIGFGTYELKVLLPKQHGRLALRIPTMHTAYRLFIDGGLVAVNGTVGTTEALSKPFYRPMIVGLPLIKKNGFVLTLQVSNFSHQKGGTWTNMEIGPAETLREGRERSLLLDFALFGGLVVMALYHLGIFVIRPSALSALYFGLFCLLFSVRVLTTGEHYITRLVPDIDWLLHIRLQYLSYILSVPIFAAFSHRLFPEEMPRLITYLAYIIGGSFAGLVILLPSTMFTRLMLPYEIFTVAAGAVLFATILLSAVRRREGSWLYLAGWSVFFATIINDIAFNIGLIQSRLVAPYGLLAFIVAQSTLLALRFSRSFATAEQLSVDLEMRIHRRTHELLQSRDELQLAKERAERADRAKSEFLTTMSHEIRTPLHSILGAASLLNEAKQTPEHREHVGILERSGRKLLTLINEILDLSKIESGKIILAHAAFDVRDVLNDVAGIMKVRADQKGISLECSCDPSIPGLLTGDAARLEQVLLNLIGNAVKFTETGTVSVSIEMQHRQGDAARLKFSVQDTGIGIAEDKREAIFESFVQAEQHSTRRYGGTGLGLAISRRLVELMGGQLDLDSEVGVGSTFRFSLLFPISKEDAPARKPKAQKEGGQTAKLRDDLQVLLADDNTDNLLLLGLFLKSTGAALQTARNGREAVALSEAHHFDVILMDIQMPELDGYEATRAIRAREYREGGQRTPIIALTADATRDAKRRAEDAGCDGYLTKPIQKQALIDAIQQMTASESES